MKLLDVLKGKLKMNRRKQHFSLLRLFCASKNCCGKVACDIFLQLFNYRKPEQCL